jgi:hypothetical protein
VTAEASHEREERGEWPLVPEVGQEAAAAGVVEAQEDQAHRQVQEGEGEELHAADEERKGQDDQQREEPEGADDKRGEQGAAAVDVLPTRTAIEDVGPLQHR